MLTRVRWSRTAAGAIVAVALAAACAVVVGVACIPDLPPDQPTDVGDGSPLCGNGVIDFDAGEQCDPGQAIAEAAAASGCTGGCRIYCPGGTVWARTGGAGSGNNHCYTQARDAASALYLATSQCAGSSHVVTIASDEEMHEIAATFGRARGPMWIGLTRGDTLPPDHYKVTKLVWPEPGWSPTCAGCYAFVADAGPLPSSGAASTGCVEDYPRADASWRQVDCNGNGDASTAAPPIVVCEQEPSGHAGRPCDGGTCFEVPWTLGSKRYLYVQKNADADAAADDCARRGGTLLTLQSSQEREEVWVELAHVETRPLEVWIGLSFVDGGWTWDDGTDTTLAPPPWGDGFPSDAGTTTRGYLARVDDTVDNTLARDENAAAQRPYVCQIAIGPDAGEAGPADAGDAGDGGDATLSEAGDDGGPE